jgi:hypothetical protein
MWIGISYASKEPRMVLLAKLRLSFSALLPTFATHLNIK